MSVFLLTTKLYIPPLRVQLIQRPRLVDRLEEGLSLGHRLTLISAPAGFGKTTLVTEWRHGRRGTTPPVTFTWLSLDESDNDPARFLTYLLSALQKIDPNIGQAVLAKRWKRPPGPAPGRRPHRTGDWDPFPGPRSIAACPEPGSPWFVV